MVVLTGDHKDKNPATKENIMAELKRLLNGNTDKTKNIQKGDIVLLAFSGHGQEVFNKDDKKSTYFAPIDGKRGDVSTLVNMSEVMELLAGCGSKNLVLADMCREIYNPNKGKGINTDNLTIPKNSAILFGCESTQESFVNEELKHSLFSYAILEVLRDNRKSGKPVSWSGLVNGVEEKFESDQFKKLMEKGKKQSPVQRSSDLGTTQLLAFAPNIVEFEYVIDGEKKKGKCEMMELDLGGGVKMEFVKIKKGKFTMGSPKEEKEHQKDEDQKEVEIKEDYWMGRYEVTQAQYKAIMGENPSIFKGDKLPVETVSWEDATKFCEKLSEKTKKKIALPSEAQWEYACRAGTTTPFHFGSVLNGDLANCHGNYPYGTETKGKYLEKTTEVGSYPANPWGLFDMHGNLDEWCLDWRDGEQKSRVLRGGSWSHFPMSCRSANRHYGSPSNRAYLFGLRVCCSIH